MGFTENDLCKEMRKLKIKYDSTNGKDRIKNYKKHLLNYFKGKTHEHYIDGMAYRLANWAWS